MRNSIYNLPSLKRMASLFGRGDGDMSVGWYEEGGLVMRFSFHVDEGTGRRGFKAMIENANMMGGFCPEYVTGNGSLMTMSGWKVGILSLIATDFGLAVKKLPQLRLAAQSLCSALTCFDYRHGASLRRQLTEDILLQRQALDQRLRDLKHEEGITTQA